MKATLADINILEYSKLQNKNEYDFALNFGNLQPLDYFKLGDIFEMTFEQVKTLQNLFSNGIDFEKYFDYVIKENIASENELLITSIFTVFKSMIYLKNEIDRVNTAEATLNSKPDPDMQAAGIEIFSKYENFGQYYTLSKGNILNIESVKKLKYSLCFLFLKYEKEVSDFERELYRIKNSKSTI